MAYGTNAPFGLRPIMHLDGSPWNGGLQNLSISSGYATTIGYGDPVTQLSDGTIGRAVSAGPLLGVFMGCQYLDTTRTLQNSKYWPASTTVATGTIPVAYVVTDPTVVYTVQETNGSQAAGTPLALTDVFLNARLLITAASTTTGGGISLVSLDNSTLSTTATWTVKVIGLDPRVGNAVGSFANWLVVANNHVLKGGTGTVGV